MVYSIENESDFKILILEIAIAFQEVFLEKFIFHMPSSEFHLPQFNKHNWFFQSAWMRLLDKSRMPSSYPPHPQDQV